MATSCHVDCVAAPPRYEPDSDISGVGVIINYVVTAGLAVLIIILYYVTVYDPSIDPFDATRERTLSVRPNPLDDFILVWLRSGPAYIAKRFLGSRPPFSPRTRFQLESVLIKCILLMSDLQIVTGLAIILSGFAQFQCGLAALKWRVILDLAWFSCLTHLSCLTVLRRHLHAHTFQRVWRLIAMGVLAAILAAGLIITANHRWLLLSEDTKATPAICIAGCSLEPGPNKTWVESLEPIPVQSWQPSEWFWTPIASAGFIVIAFVSRVVRLHRTSSSGVRRATKWLDGQMQRALWVLFKTVCIEGDTRGLGRAFVYRPVFGAVMILRFLLDSLASFAVEVNWVFGAFLWGIWRLVKDLSPGNTMEPIDSSKQAWTFGQVVSVFTLVAPLISVLGALEENLKSEEYPMPPKPPDNHRCSRLPLDSLESSERDDPERPDTDWSSHSSLLGTATAYIYLCCVFMGYGFFRRMAEGSSPMNYVRVAGYSILKGIYCFYCMVLCSLTVEAAVPRDRRWLRRLFQFLVIGLFMTGWALGAMVFQHWQIFAGIGVYVVGALLHRVIGWSQWTSGKSIR